MSQSQSARSLPELAERDAPAEIATIYADIRRLSGVPMVALIWRHLATRPGVLPQIWGSLAPLMATGNVQEAAWHGSEVAVQGKAEGFTSARLRAAGVDAAGETDLVNVLDAYNRANPINFVMVAVLRELLRDTGRYDLAADVQPDQPAGVRAMRGSLAPSWTPPAPLPQLPPMCLISELEGAMRRSINDLSADPAVDRSRIVPTLYRHLNGWPPLIPLIHDVLLQRFRSGEISAQIIRVSDSLGEAGRQLAPRAGPLGSFADVAEVCDTLDRFARLIPEMIVVGKLLRRALSA